MHQVVSRDEWLAARLDRAPKGRNQTAPRFRRHDECGKG
jgi:predicted dithiol-disulfide oxidoreductase (DUF899 family)